MERISAIVSGIGTAEGVGRYLPEDFKVVIAAEGNRRVLALIEGPAEESGWGFSNYVVPRLASGNYGVREVDPDAGYLAVSGARGLFARESLEEKLDVVQRNFENECVEHAKTKVLLEQFQKQP